MSARGSLNCGKFFSESARYVPAVWLALLHSDDCPERSRGPFTLERKPAIDRAKKSIPFLATIFPEFPEFESSANAFLQRLAKLRAKTIEIDILELMPNANYLFADALNAIDNQTLAYNRKVKASIEVDPETGLKFSIDKANYRSTRDLLLDICGLTPREIEMADDDERTEIITGHVW